MPTVYITIRSCLIYHLFLHHESENAVAIRICLKFKVTVYLARSLDFKPCRTQHGWWFYQFEYAPEVTLVFAYYKTLFITLETRH